MAEDSSADAKMEEKEKIPRKSFSPQEDLLLRNLVAVFGAGSWREISRLMPGRTCRQVRERWNEFLSPNISNSPWTAEEDERLKALVAENGPKWAQIAKCFVGRSGNNVKNRWHSHLRSMVVATPKTDKPKVIFPAISEFAPKVVQNIEFPKLLVETN